MPDTAPVHTEPVTPDAPAAEPAVRAAMRIALRNGCALSRDAAEQIAEAILGCAGEGATAVTEHANQMSGGGFHVWNTEPYILEIYPLAEKIRHGQQHGGHVYRRRVIVVEDWEEVRDGGHPM